MIAPATGFDVVWDHVLEMTDERAMFEHADRNRPRFEHGYCVDDNARLLVVASQERDVGPAGQLSRLALTFVLGSQDADGRCRNRMNHAGQWTDRASTDDCWGRALWGLGVAAAHHQSPEVRACALAGFDASIGCRSASIRSMAFGAIGAAHVAGHFPEHDAARSFLDDALRSIGGPLSHAWPWPESKLTYANAVLAEAVIAAGSVLDQDADRQRGLAMLGWLCRIQDRGGHLSVVGTGGRSIGETGPQFDQQPIEAAALADACWRAFTLTGDAMWARGIEAAAGWFHGRNDGGVMIGDHQTGGGYDGLSVDGVNTNQGAESTLAYLSTMQRASALAAHA